MRSSMHDDANHTSRVCFPFFCCFTVWGFFICLVGEKNVRNMGFVVWELEEKGLFRFFPPLLILYDVGFPCLFGW